MREMCVCVTKLCVYDMCDKVLCERLCVCDKVLCERLCVTKLRVKDCAWQSGV